MGRQLGQTRMMRVARVTDWLVSPCLGSFVWVNPVAAPSFLSISPGANHLQSDAYVRKGRRVDRASVLQRCFPAFC